MGLRNKKPILIFSLILLIVLEANGQANNSIAGFVFGLERRPVAEASVELSDENNSLIGRVKTDGSGRYFFTRLRRGRYNIRVSALGTDYESQIKEVEVSGLTRGGASNAGSETIEQNFVLFAKRQNSGNLAKTQVVFAQDVPKEAQKLYEKGVSLLKDKKIDEGISFLQKALELFPSYFLVLDTLGQEYISQQKYQEAYSVLIKAVEANPKTFSSQYSLGYSLFQLKRYSESLKVIEKSVEIAPNSVNGFFLLGMCLKKLEQYGSAVESLRKADKLANSQQPDIHWQLSLIYTNNLKKYAEAANALELFLKTKPDYEEAEKVRELIKKLKAKAKG